MEFAILHDTSTTASPYEIIGAQMDINASSDPLNSVDGVNTDDQKQDIPNYGFFLLWSISVLIVTITVITIVGNLSVIIVYALSKQLQKFSNNFIISLALADLTVGCCMPVSLVVTLSGYWPYKKSICRTYALFESAMCYTSFLSILMISFDRWWSIHWPFQYRVKQSRRRSVVIIVISWILSLVLFGPVNMLWQKITGKETDIVVVSLKCKRNTDDFNIVFSSTLVTFFLPLIVLIICNMSIYVKIAGRKDNSIRRSMSENFSCSRKSSSDSSVTADEQATELLKHDINDNSTENDSKNNEESNDVNDLNATLQKRLPNGRPILLRRHSCAPCGVFSTKINSAPTSTNSTLSYSQPKMIPPPLSRRVSFDMGVLSDGKRLKSLSRRSSTLSSRNSKLQRRASVNEELIRDIFSKQDRKAARALALLVIMVTICWAPNVIIRIISSALPGSIPFWLKELSFWLVLLNSCLNPYLYATGNTKYRKVIRACFGKRRAKNNSSFNSSQNQQQLINKCTFRGFNQTFLSKQYMATVSLNRNIWSNVILKPS